MIYICRHLANQMPLLLLLAMSYLQINPDNLVATVNL